MVLVHDKLCASKAAIVFFSIDMSFVTTAIYVDRRQAKDGARGDRFCGGGRWISRAGEIKG